MSAPRTRAGSTKRLWAAGVVIVAALGFLLFKGLTSAITFFKTANQAIADRSQLGNSVFQLEGTVVPGTVHKVGGDVYDFIVESHRVRVHISNTGAPPQLFRPGMPVVVVGHFLGSSNVFASDQIMVKHSQSYIAAHPQRVKAADGPTR